MLPSFSTFVGISTSLHRRDLTYLALSSDRRLLAVGDGSVVDALSFIAGQNSALVAISPPAHAKTAALLTASTQLPLELNGGARIQPPSGASSAMKHCFSLAGQLADLGYCAFSDPDSPHQWLETQAEAGFTALLGHEPLPAGTLEGRMQRQFVLEDLDLDVPDAMLFFEEVTRFRMLRGQLPMKYVLPQGELEAWLAAYTAWQFAQPGAPAPTPGQIVIPSGK